MNFARRTYLVSIVSLFFVVYSLQATGEPKVVIVSNVNLNVRNVVDRLCEQVVKHNLSDEAVLVVNGGFLYNRQGLDDLVKSVEILKDCYEDVYLIPGPGEWEILKSQGVRYMDDLFQEHFDQDIVVPDNACGELEIKNVSDRMVIAALDSKWYLQNWEQDNFVNRDCRVKDRSRFWFHFNEELSGEKDKMILLFTHHPPLRFDKSSGHHPIVDHLLPFPVLGTIITTIRDYTRSYSYATHPRYRTYSDQIMRAVQIQPNAAVVSSEGAYQMDHRDDGDIYLNVNTGNSDEFVAGKKTDWSANERSYLIVGLEGTKVSRRWYRWENDALLYSKQEELNRELIDTMAFADDQMPTSGPSKIVRPVLQKGDIIDPPSFLFGQLHTELFYVPVEAKVLHLAEYRGGLETEKMGGGRQTRSIRLEDGSDVEYAVRSIKKTPSKLVPPPFDISPIKSIVSYYFTAAHPYGFLVSSSLESALGLYRTNPALRYLPRQKALQPYNDEIGDRLVLMRSRADGSRENEPDMGFSKNIIGTADLLDEVYENDARIDPEMYLKARLLDLLINDWDRHEDQWRWAEDTVKGDDMDTFYPIPRDRDQALSNYDGFLLAYIRPYNPLIFQMRPFDHELTHGDIKWMHNISSFLDKAILTQLDLETWETIDREVRDLLSEDALRTAVGQLPEEINAGHREEVFQKLKSRVAGLPETSRILYDLVFRKAYLAGSVYRDSIYIAQEEEGTLVKIYSQNDDGERLKKFERHFSPHFSQEIWINAMEGDDVFVMDEKHKTGQKIRLLGGFGNDQYKNIGQKKPDFHIYDVQPDEVHFQGSRQTISKNKELVNISKRDFMMDYNWFLPSAAFNSDDGIYLGGKWTYNHFGFKTRHEHTVSASVSGKRRSSEFSYRYQRHSRINGYSPFFEARFYGPRYELNYFGTGNGASLDLDQPDDYYFVRKKSIEMQGGIIKELSGLGHLSIGLGLEGNKIDDVSGRFTSETRLPVDPIFKYQFFAGLNAEWFLSNFDSRLKPHNGVELRMRADARKHLNNGSRDHLEILASFRWFRSMGSNDRLIFASKLSATHIFGDAFFYQNPSLGGGNDLRGFRRDRFYGHTRFYHQNNVHLYLGGRNPAKDALHSWGTLFSFDHGRVWSDEDLSDEWFYSYGFGLFFSPLDVGVLSGSFHFSKEERQIRIGLGWQI